jgi:hypothetical protein
MSKGSLHTRNFSESSTTWIRASLPLVGAGSVSPEHKELIERAAAYSGRTVSDFVLAHVEIAASLIVVDSKEERAKHFYQEYGFISLPKYSDRMFLPMKTAEKL